MNFQSLVVLIITILWNYLVFNADAGVTFKDAGEIATSSFLLGISHPTGFSPYLLVGKFFSFIPFGSIYFRLSLVSTLAVVLSLFFIAKLSLNFFHNLSKTLGLIWLITIVSTIISTQIVLLHTIKVEIYGATLCISSILIYLSLCPKGDNDQANLLFRTTMFLIGIGGAIHAQIFLVGCLSILLQLRWKEFYHNPKGCFYNLINSLGLFIYGYLSLPLYLFLRGDLTRYPFNWDDTSNINGILNHIAGYRIKSAYSMEMFNISLIPYNFYNYFNKILLPSLGYFFITTTIFTLGICIKNKLIRAVGYFLIVSVFYDIFINPMGIKDLQVGFIGVTLALFISLIGINYILSYIRVLNLRNYFYIILGVGLTFLSLIKLPATIHNVKDNFLPQFIVTEGIVNLPQRSLILCISDDICSSFNYLRLCEGIRNDIVIIPRQHLQFKHILQARIGSYSYLKGIITNNNLNYILNTLSKQIPVWIEGGDWYEVLKFNKNKVLTIVNFNYLFKITEVLPDLKVTLRNIEGLISKWDTMVKLNNNHNSIFTKEFILNHIINIGVYLINYYGEDGLGKKFFEYGLKLTPYNPVLLTNLAILYLRENNISKAINLLEMVEKYDPLYKRASLILAKLYLNSNKIIEAEELYERILYYDNRCDDCYSGLGIIKAKEGDYKKSLILFQKALKLNPQNEEANIYIKKILDFYRGK